MAWHTAFTWLVHAALATTLLMVCGAAAVLLCRQQADRLRVIQCTLVALLAALCAAALPLSAPLSLAILPAAEERPPLPPADEPPLMASVPAEPIISPAGLEDSAPSEQPARLDDRPLSAVSPVFRPEAMPADPSYAELAVRAVVLAYLAGFIVMVFRWARAAVHLRQLRRSAAAVPPTIASALSRIAGPGASRVTVLQSDRVDAPITWGLFRPVIVLPSRLCDEHDAARLRYCLAHEWAHIARRDIATWTLATVLQSILFYQPLFWWLRRRLAISMDELADAVAAEHGPSTADYAAFLLELARRRLFACRRPPEPALGISDKSSRLCRRVLTLIKGEPLRLTCPRTLTLGLAAVALALTVVVSAVRLEGRTPSEGAQPAAAEKPQEGERPAEDAAVESITYNCRVTDGVTGKPIEGVKVIIHRKLSRDPETHTWRTLEATEHLTDAQGEYSFTLPPEQVAQSSLYLEVEAHHPNYASKGRSGYSHAMIRKNLELGEQPFYSHIQLWPGEPVLGRVVSPQGEPLPGIEVSMYSTSDQANEGFPRGSFDKTQTDADGRFRIVPATPGDGVLWIKPERFAPQAHRLGDRRGDWGTLTMEEGTAVTGQVLDARGQPVAGVDVEARRRGDGEEPDEFLRNNAVANQIGRQTTADEDGRFTLDPLPDGEYSIEISPHREEGNYDPSPLEQVFLRRQLTISNGLPANAIEIRAVPHVYIRGTYLNSQGEPRLGHQLHLFGRIDDGFFFTQSSRPADDGKFELRLPHGLQEVEIDPITNEHSAIRWRLSSDTPLYNDERINLGTVEEDVSGLEIVRYMAPILVVKVVNEDGEIVEDLEPKGVYDMQPPNDAKWKYGSKYSWGMDVRFNRQEDGRWRTSQLLPDQQVKVSVEKDGYTAAPQELSIPEGEERELEVVLKKE